MTTPSVARFVSNTCSRTPLPNGNLDSNEQTSHSATRRATATPTQTFRRDGTPASKTVNGAATRLNIGSVDNEKPVTHFGPHKKTSTTVTGHTTEPSENTRVNTDRARQNHGTTSDGKTSLSADFLNDAPSQSLFTDLYSGTLKSNANMCKPLVMKMSRARRVIVPATKFPHQKNKPQSRARISPGVNLPLSSLVDRCATRMDIWTIPDMSHILLRLGRDLERKKTAMLMTGDGIQLCDWCIVIFLDKTKLALETSDTADVAQELHEEFPGLLSVHRFPTWSTLKEDIIQVGLKKILMTPCRNGDRGRFQAFITRAAGKMRFQGITAPLGDVNAFWNGHTPADYVQTYHDIEVVGKLSSTMRMFAYFSSSNVDHPFATASQYLQEPTVYKASGGLQVAAICAGCKKLESRKDLLPMPGNTFCCQTCHFKYFDICRVCLNDIHKPMSVSLPCGHKSCPECVVHKFDSSNKHIDDFPPQCCDQEIIVHDFLKLLPDAVIRAHLAMRERKVAQKDAGCATPTCEKRTIKYYNVGDDWALCSQCLDLTCIRCSKLKGSHEIIKEPRRCPPPDDSELLSLAEASNWKACPKCRNMVSRSGGCNTMRCRCGQGFCYTCGKEFEGTMTTCGCPMTFDTTCVAERAEARADQVVGVVEWPNQELMLDCPHDIAFYVRRQRCHGCLQDAADLIRRCIRCSAALCRECRNEVV